MSILRVTYDAARGLQCRQRPAKDGRGENRLATHSFKPTMTHVINLFAPFPVVKQKGTQGSLVSRICVLGSHMVIIANF